MTSYPAASFRPLTAKAKWPNKPHRYHATINCLLPYVVNDLAVCVSELKKLDCAVSVLTLFVGRDVTD